MPRHRTSPARCTWTPLGVALAVGGWRLAAEDLYRTRAGQAATVTIHCGEELCYREHLNLDRVGPRQRFLANLARTCRPALHRLTHQVTEQVLILLGEACRRRAELRPAPMAPPAPGRPAARRPDARVRALLEDRHLLARVATAMRGHGWAGNCGPPQLAYVALTARLLERPMNLAFVAAPASGKNATIDAALALIPPEAVYVFTAASPTALIYTPEDLRSRTVLFKEADSLPDSGPAASAIHSLAEGHALEYAVTVLNRQTGQFETRTITRPGPTGLLTTSTRPLRPQLSTRLLPVPVPDDAALTRAVLHTKAQHAAGATPRPDVAPFVALQQWLAEGGERRVIIPFAAQLAEVVGGRTVPDVRLRRDFEQLLSCIQAVAVLYQRQRKTAPGGEIIASIRDYAVARQLLEPSFAAAAAEGPTAAIWETVLAIREGEQNVSEIELARRLERTKQAISWRVTRAVAAGWLVNHEPRSGRPYRLTRGNPLPWAASALPDWQAVEPPVPEVPAPALTARLFGFGTTVVQQWPTGVTLDEWVAGRTVDTTGAPFDVAALRAQFEGLRRAGWLDYDRPTDRYVPSAALRQWLADAGGSAQEALEPGPPAVTVKAQAFVEKMRSRRITPLDASRELDAERTSYADADLRFIAEQAPWPGIVRHAQRILAERDAQATASRPATPTEADPMVAGHADRGAGTRPPR